MPGLEKQYLLKELKEAVGEAEAIFFARFTRLAVGDMNELRRQLATVAKRSLVPKNTLLRGVLKELNYQAATSFVNGQVFLTTADRDPQEVSKVLVTFAKERESFGLQGACIDGEVVEALYLKQLAALPSQTVLRGAVVRGIQAPIANFVLTLQGMIRSLVVVLGAVHKQRASASSHI